MQPPEIEKLDAFEYMAALTYATTAFQIRNMSTTENTPTATGEVAVFEQPSDYDHDPKYKPNFVSDVGKQK